MDATTPKIENMTPNTGRMVNDQYLFKITNNTNQTVNVIAGFNWIEDD